MNTSSWMNLKALCWVKESSLKCSHIVWLHLHKCYNYIYGKQISSCQRVGMVVGSEWVGVTLKKSYEGNFCGNDMVLYVDCGGAYTNPHKG